MQGPLNKMSDWIEQLSITIYREKQRLPFTHYLQKLSMKSFSGMKHQLDLKIYKTSLE